MLAFPIRLSPSLDLWTLPLISYRGQYVTSPDWHRISCRHTKSVRFGFRAPYPFGENVPCYVRGHTEQATIPQYWLSEGRRRTRAYNSVILSHWGRYKWPTFPRRHFQMHFVKENASISIIISLKFVPKTPINNITALVQIMTWRRPGDKPLSDPIMVRLPTHICVTRPHWVIAPRVWKACL